MGSLFKFLAYCLTGLRFDIKEPGFHMWKDSSVPTSSSMLENATVCVFDGLPSGPALDDFMNVIKET